MNRGLRAGLAAGLVLLALAACAPTPPAARPVTTEEAQLLAVVRFNNFNAGTRSFTAGLTSAGTEVDLEGWVDFESEVGYAVLTATDSPASLLVWDASTLAARPLTDDEAVALLEPPIATPATLDGFGTTVLSSDGTLHSLLSILLALGSDRPDNPLLLQQGGSLWLRTDTIESTAVTVFSGSTDSESADDSNPRYWVDAVGLLHRCEVLLGIDWTTIDLGDGTDVNLDNPFVESP